MHTIYFQNAPARLRKGGMRNAPVQVLGHAPTPDIAVAHLLKMGREWLASKAGRKVIHSGVEARFLYSDGKLAAVADFDPIPAVAEEPDAQPRRGKGVKA